MEITDYTPGMTITPPMLIRGMPNNIYHSWPDSISNSALTLIDQSPAHFAYAEPREATRDMEIGTAIHTAILEPERYAKEYMILKDTKARTASEYKQAVKVYGSERVLIGHEADRVAGMQESVYSHPVARELMRRPAENELSLFVNDPETGALVRVRYDRLITGSNIAVDLKKTQDARASEFPRSVFNYRYQVQAALYSDAFFWATGECLESFRFLVIEEKMPHAVMVYRLDETALADGRRIYRENLNTYAACLASGDWPAYECGADEVIGLPDWRVRQIENEMDETGITFTGEE